MTNPKIYIFDLGGVICDIRDEAEWIFDFMEPVTGRGALEATGGALFRDFETGKIGQKEFIRAVRQSSDREFTDNQFLNAWNDRILSVREDVVEALDYFCSDRECYMLSNTNPAHKSFIIELISDQYGNDRFSKWFRHCYFSDELGLIKPDMLIYEAVNGGIGSPDPAECLFIDDSRVNIEAARKFGWQAILAERRLPEILHSL